MLCSRNIDAAPLLAILVALEKLSNRFVFVTAEKCPPAVAYRSI
jgi:hypothetical protein